jgi:hypothetical protein
MPYYPKEGIEEVLGFSSRAIQSTISEGQTQLIFVKDKKVICSIYGYSNHLGFYVNAGNFDGEFLVVKKGDAVSFFIENSEDGRALTLIKP